MTKITTTTIILALILLCAAPSFPQSDLSSEIKDPELEQEFRWLKAETYVITASKVKENIKKAPASITVVTDKQIRHMGARHLADVLRAVPGYRPAYFFSGVSDYRARGIGGSGGISNGILLMIDSHPVNEPGTGGFNWFHDTLIVDNAKRIEFIRGPGSAIYGANAFFGVINVITKEAEDIDGLELAARGGSYDSQQYNLLYGKTFRDLEVAFNFNYFKTHGFRGLIEEDWQTQLDRDWAPFRILFGIPPASLAPGRMAGNDEKYETALTLKYKGFTFDSRYVDRERDLPVGWLPVLNNKSILSLKDYYFTLRYETNMWENLALSGKVYRNYQESSNDFQIFPPGYVTLTPNPAPPPDLIPAIMPDGMLDESSGKNSRMGIDMEATYKLTDSNTFLAGVTYEEMKRYDMTTRANYLPDPYKRQGVVIPLPSVQKWPGRYVGNTEKINFKAIFFEDIWDFTEDLRLTTGARYDHYSDFGGHFSPRVGLTWEYMKGYDLKLLYGHAFRAPSFFELYSIRLGNPDLDPQEIDSYELSLGGELTSSLTTRGTLYYRKQKKMIAANDTSTKYINFGQVSAHGFEVEMKYDFGRGTYISGNYSYSSIPTVDAPTGKLRNWVNPRHTGDIMVNIRLSRYFNFNADCYFAEGFRRDYGDRRDNISGYAIVNTTLIAKKFLKGYEGLELRGSVYNILDKDYAHPQEPRLPNDMPMPGVNYLLEIKYGF